LVAVVVAAVVVAAVLVVCGIARTVQMHPTHRVFGKPHRPEPFERFPPVEQPRHHPPGGLRPRGLAAAEL
jgi:hypothetical protein